MSAEKLLQWAKECDTELWVIESPENNYQPKPPVGYFGMRSHKRRAFFKRSATGQIPSSDYISSAMDSGDFQVVEHFCPTIPQLTGVLQWSKEPPKVEGNYWWRDNRDNGTKPSIVYISQLDRDVDARRKAGTWVWCGHYCTEGTVRQDGWNEWAGPVECPPILKP